MSDPVKDFASYLASITNETERARILSRARMLAVGQAPEEAFEAPIRTLGEYLDTAIEIPPSLVWPTIAVRGELTVTIGRAGKGKTTMNIHRILAWSAGKPMFENFTSSKGEVYLKPEEPLKTLIIENEGNAAMFHHKMGLRVYNSNLFTKDEQQVVRENILVWGNGGYSGFKLDNDKDVSTIKRGLEKHKPDIVFIEPFRQLWQGDENSAKDMSIVVDNILDFAHNFGCAVILSHHERKGGAGDDGELMSAGRGSTVLEGVAAVMENFQSVKGGDERELTWSKARYLQAPPPMRLKYDRERDLYDFIPVTDIEQAILEELAPTAQGDEPLNVAALSDALEEKPDKIRKITKKLVAEGRIKQLPSTYTGNGTTGHRFTLLPDPQLGGGLEI